ncbi:AAA family ATPase [Spirillospora sp. NPDC127200]
MTTLFITRGLPGSGKTYHAATWTAEDPAHRARVNRDDLRLMIDDGRYIGGVTERRIIAARDAAIIALLDKGVDVISDDTNLKQRVVRDLIALARRAGADVQVVDFTDVPLEVCIERDRLRDRQVGEQTIRDMHARFLKGRALPLPLPEAPADAVNSLRRYEAKPGTPRAVLVDIDGTTALMCDRSPFDESRVQEDRPNGPVIEVIRSMVAAGFRVVFLSGRTAACRDATDTWLRTHVVPEFEALHMRPVGDYRKDSVVKAELFDAHVRDAYDVTCVLDDRNQVVEMWRAMGLTVLQVAEGDF